MQGLEGLGLAVLGGELQHIGHVSLLVGLHVAGDDHAVAVSQALTGQVVALVLSADFVQVPVVLYTVYSAVVGSAASLEAASELAASLDAAAEDATEEEAAVEEELPQAVMPTASARAVAAIATFLSFI